MTTRKQKLWNARMAQKENNNPAPVWCRCDNCQAVCPHTHLVALSDVKNLNERLDEGGEVPAGECGKCGALSYIIDVRANIKQYIKRGGHGCPVCGGQVEADTPKTDDAGIICDITCTLCGSTWKDLHTVTEVLDLHVMPNDAPLPKK